MPEDINGKRRRAPVDTLCTNCIYLSRELHEMPCKVGFYKHLAVHEACPFYEEANCKEEQNEDIQ